MRIVHVTGCDARYFLTTLVFLEALRERVPEADMRVCDFGMTDAQADMLRGAGTLLERPARLPKGAHPYLCKGHLLDYLADEPWDAAMWLDSDMVPGAFDVSASDALARRMAEAGAGVAVATAIDGASIADTVAELRGAAANISGFERLLDHWRIDRSRPYINVGVVMFTDRERLADWAATCRKLPPHPLWEQNVLAAMIARNPEIARLLDPFEWQIYDAPLAEVVVSEEAGRDRLTFRGRSIMWAHATSRGGRHHADAALDLAFGEFRLKGGMRLFAHPDLRRSQMAYLAKAVRRHGDGLRAVGALVAT